MRRAASIVGGVAGVCITALMPAEETVTGSPRSAARAASATSPNGDRHWFAVQTNKMCTDSPATARDY